MQKHFPLPPPASLNKICIIGGGIGGLAAAIRLACYDVQVAVFEKQPILGGKLNAWNVAHPSRNQTHSFRFDTGPSLLTMPYVFADLFAAAGRDVRDYLTIRRLDPAARFVWNAGQTFELSAATDALLEQVRRVSPADVRGVQKLLDRGRKHWPLAEPFIARSIDQLRSDPNGSIWQMIATPFRIGAFGNFQRSIDRLITHPRLRAVFHQYATYAGVAPWQAPASLNVIPWVEHHFGGWHIDGGMYALATALEKLARELDVEIHTDGPVKQIRIESASDHVPRASAVELEDGRAIAADAVVVNADAVYAYRKLIAPEFRPSFSDQTLDAYDPGGSGMILLLGVDGTYPQLAHHTKFMPDDYTAELRQVFTEHRIPDDPCIYVCAATRSDPTLAPEGCENLFILVSAPSLKQSDIDWSVAGPAYRDRILQTLETRCGLTDLRRRIVVNRMMTPVDLQGMYNANYGSIYGVAPSNWRGKFARPQNHDKHIANLFFAGGAAHPGGGLPLVAMSGKIAADLVVAHLHAPTRSSINPER